MEKVKTMGITGYPCIACLSGILRVSALILQMSKLRPEEVA